jgi:hypothetical protein
MSTTKYNYEYFRQRLDESKKRIDELEKQEKCLSDSIQNSKIIIGKKKRTYKEAFGYDNDYICVQEPSKDYSVIYTNNNILWKDAYIENLLKTTSST